MPFSALERRRPAPGLEQHANVGVIRYLAGANPLFWCTVVVKR